MQSPLDIPGMITLLAFTAQESPDHQLAVQAILRRCMDLAGIEDIKALKIRKLQGSSVFGQDSALYPQASSKDVEGVRSQIKELLDSMVPVEVPSGRPIVVGPDWEMPTASAAVLTIDETYYSPPLNGLG